MCPRAKGNRHDVRTEEAVRWVRAPGPYVCTEDDVCADHECTEDDVLGQAQACEDDVCTGDDFRPPLTAAMADLSCARTAGSWVNASVRSSMSPGVRPSCSTREEEQ